MAVQPVSLHFCTIRHSSETSRVSTSICLLADISTGASCNAIWVPTMRLRRLQWQPRNADPTAPLSPIEMWRKIEQDLDSKTALPVETRDCWLYGIYKKLPGGTRFEIECGTARSVGRCRQASETQKARTRAPTGAWFR